MDINNHLLIRTGEYTIYDMSKGIEYEYLDGLHVNETVDDVSISLPKVTARSIHTEDVWAMRIAEGSYAVKFWQWLQIHAKNQRDLQKDIEDIIPF